MRWLLLALVLGATAAFVVGSGLERAHSDSHVEAAAVGGESHGDGTETGEGAATETAADSAGEGPAAEGEFKPLGINAEATPFIVLAGLGSLLLAVLAVARPSPSLLALVAALMAAFAVLDVVELVHQLDDGNAGLAAVAAVAAVLHGAAALVAAVMSRRAAAGVLGAVRI